MEPIEPKDMTKWLAERVLEYANHRDSPDPVCVRCLGTGNSVVYLPYNGGFVNEPCTCTVRSRITWVLAGDDRNLVKLARFYLDNKDRPNVKKAHSKKTKAVKNKR